jgi:hypothetical protein
VEQLHHLILIFKLLQTEEVGGTHLADFAKYPFQVICQETYMLAHMYDLHSIAKRVQTSYWIPFELDPLRIGSQIPTSVSIVVPIVKFQT